MIVGTCIYEIAIPGALSLKDKRRVLKSVIERARHKFNISISEIERQDQWQHAVIGVAAVSNNTLHVNQVLNNVTKYMETANDEMELINVTMEIS